MYGFPIKWSIVTPPAVEPLSETEVWEQLHLDPETDDGTVGRLISAARLYVETFTRRALIQQTLKRALDWFPPQIMLPRPPLISVDEITYVDPDGVEQTLSASIYHVDSFAEPAHVCPAYEEDWPSTRQQANAVVVTYSAGYGEKAEDVPQDLRQALLFIVGYWYANREAGGRVPDHINEILYGYRVYPTLGG